jgi:Fur family ferric uptake transcriptional regulator
VVEPVQQLKNTLRSNELSYTLARRTVFAALLGSEPQSMNELIWACRQIDPATVYRTISLFERLGIVERLQIGWKYKLELSDSFDNHHHHLTCRICGSTIRLPEDQLLENRLSAMADAQNFIMQGHQLEVQGLCSNCH